MSELLESIDWGYLWDQVLRLARDPYSNIRASLLLLSAVVLVVLIVSSIVIAIVTSVSSKPRKSQEAEELAYLLSVLEEEEGGKEAPVTAPESPPVEGRGVGYPWRTWATALVPILLLLAIALGATTSSSAVCQACHTETSHSAAVAAGVADAHASLSCVQCHESSGWLGSVTIEVPERAVHYVNGLRARPKPSSYGRVASSACYRCHRSVARETTLDEKRGVKMAHKQPLDAGAECRDCHTLITGVISSLTVGMAPCLRCHDGEQESSECTVCHTKDFTLATRSHVNPAELTGRKLVATPDCGACHDQKRTCDPCHGGVRMPHTDVFLWWGHAREGVKDIWYNDGKACGTCHTATRRPCTKCHAFFPGHPVTVFPTSHGLAKDDGPCNGCHGSNAYLSGRDFCAICHDRPYVRQ